MGEKILEELTTIAQANGGMGYAKPKQPCEVCGGSGKNLAAQGRKGYEDCSDCKGTGKKGGV